MFAPSPKKEGYATTKASLTNSVHEVEEERLHNLKVKAKMRDQIKFENQML